MLNGTHTNKRNGALGTTIRRLLPLSLVAIIALVLGADAPGNEDEQRRRTRDVEDLETLIEDLFDDSPAGFWEPGGGGPEWATDAFAEANIFFEENTTDDDLGLHFFLDGPGWKRIKIFDPTDRRVVDIKVRGNVKDIGLTEIFSESAEPGYDELPRADFLALFPAGAYRIVGKTLDGDRLESTVMLTQDLPAPPVITEPREDDRVRADRTLTIRWDGVADPNPPMSVIESYHVVVEKDEDNERLRVLAVDMAPTDRKLKVAKGFLEPGKDYKVEIIAEETSGNKVLSELPFRTRN